MVIRLLLVLPLLAAMGWAADYQVVLKSSGKVIHGDLLSEDGNTVTLKVNRAEVTFRKDRLDLARMKELNQPHAASASATLGTDGLPAIVADEIRHREKSLATAKKFVADCDAGRIKCTQNDYKVAYGQIDHDEHTLQFLRSEQGTSEDQDGQSLVRELKEHIAERKRTLADYQAQPPSGERDRHIHEIEEELRMKNRALVELELEYGVSENSELIELRKRHEEAFAQAEEAQQAYDSLPANASKAEGDARWQRFREAEERWHEAKDALTKALQQER